MYYRSDWPEIGLPTPLNQWSLADLTAHPDNKLSCVQETQFSGATFRWVANQSKFESSLYRFPIWNLHLEVGDVNRNVLTFRLGSAAFQGHVNEGIRLLLDSPPWGAAYVSCKVVQNEPLHDALVQFGFEEVEFRRLYMCRVRDIASRPPPTSEGQIRFTSLAAVAPNQLSTYREQILDICHEAFDEKGHSRHFSDPPLLKELSGVTYILAVMELNFKHVAPEHFLLAVETGSNRVCGFSAVGRKPGLGGETYTQLLSAVRKTYRGQGIYRGLTHLLSQILPQDSRLLNVTHVSNRAMQRAYQESGRVRLADTVTLRRVFHIDG